MQVNIVIYSTAKKAACLDKLKQSTFSDIKALNISTLPDFNLETIQHTQLELTDAARQDDQLNSSFSHFICNFNNKMGKSEWNPCVSFTFIVECVTTESAA